MGKYLTGSFGWRTHTILNPDTANDQAGLLPVTLVPDFGSHPVSLALGVLGMPGLVSTWGRVELLINPFEI